MRLMKSIVLSVALPVALTCATRAEAQKGNPCGNGGTMPQVFAAVVEAPAAWNGADEPPPGWNPTSGRLTRGDIHYVSGNYVHLRLTTDRCAYISGVQMGTRVLTTTGEAGYGYWAGAADPQPADPAQYAHLVRVQFPAVGDGATDQITVSVRRSLGVILPTLYRFTVVRVTSVEFPAAFPRVGVVRDEVFNMFGRALAGRFDGPGNTTTVTALGIDFSLQYLPSTLAMNVTPSGIGFEVKFRLDVGCDLTFRVYGRFTLDSGLGVVWVQEPEVSPSGCELPQLIPLLGTEVRRLILYVAEGADLATAIEDAVRGELPEASSFIEHVTTEWDQLLVHLDFGLPSVRIRVPYDAFDMGRGPTVFPAGQAIALFASGVGMHDAAAGMPGTSASAGPNGLPLGGTTTWPNPRALGRSGPLPFPGLPVAQLLARSVPSGPEPDFVTYAYSPGCSVPAPALEPLWLQFGVNDTAADAARLRQDVVGTWGYHLRVLFLDTGNTCTTPPPPPNDVD